MQLPLNLSGILGQNNFTSVQGGRNDYKAKDGMVIGGTFSPFIRYGYVSPPLASVTTVTLDQTQNSTFKASHYDPINDDMYFAEDGQMFLGDTTADTSLARVFLTPNTNSDSIKDIDIYMVNGVRKMFVVYQTSAGKADIAISSLPYNGASDDPTWLTATVSGAFTNSLSGDAFLQVSDNGFAYLLMENQVHKIDGTAATGGTNGTVTPNSLLFPVGYKMVDALDLHGLMFIAIHNYNVDTRSATGVSLSGPLTVGVYVWDKQTTVFGTTDYIPLPGFTIINKLFLSPTGKIRVLATDTNNVTQLMEYDGTAFVPLISVGVNSKPLCRDSLGVFEQTNVWFGQDGYLYFYGSLAPKDPEGLYKVLNLNLSAVSGGVILVANNVSGSPAVYITYYSSGAALTNIRYKIYTGIGQVGGTTAGNGILTFPVKYLPVYSKVNYIKVPCIPTSSAGASTQIASIAVYLNQSSNSYTTKAVYQLEANAGIVDIPINKVGVWAIQLEITWSLNTIGTNDFAINAGYVDYEPIIKRK